MIFLIKMPISLLFFHTKKLSPFLVGFPLFQPISFHVQRKLVKFWFRRPSKPSHQQGPECITRLISKWMLIWSINPDIAKLTVPDLNSTRTHTHYKKQVSWVQKTSIIWDFLRNKRQRFDFIKISLWSETEEKRTLLFNLWKDIALRLSLLATYWQKGIPVSTYPTRRFHLPSVLSNTLSSYFLNPLHFYSSAVHLSWLELPSLSLF